MGFSPFTEIAVILLAAVLLGAVGVGLRQPLIVAFIGVGVLAGPAGAGLITQHAEIELLASVGIALLLFVVGLKLDVHLIRTVGPVALVTGVAQVIVTAAIGFGLALALGFSTIPAVYIAAALTFSSTIIIVKLLSDAREIDALHGRIAVGVLIVQDIAVIAAMIGLAAAGAGIAAAPEANAAALVAGVLLKGLALLAGVAIAMRWVLPRLTTVAARSGELLLLFAVAWAVAMAAAGDVLGFGKEVGAFLAGVSLASTPYRETIAGRLVALRDFLLLFFFIDLGARLDVSLLGATAASAIVLSVFVLLGKPLIMMVIMGVMGYRKRTGFLAGLTMAQISEFSLILGALGLGLGHIDGETMGLITLVGLVTIGLSTYPIVYSGQLYERFAHVLSMFERRTPYREVAGDTSSPRLPGADVILFGLGRYGGSIARLLLLRNRRVIGVDFDPQVLAVWREAGVPVLYGDAEDPELFEHLPLRDARWVVGTAPDTETSRVLLRHLKQLGYTGSVAVACRVPEDEESLRAAGASVILRPFAAAAEQAADILTSAMANVQAIAPDMPGLRDVRLNPGSVLAGQTIEHARFGEQFGVTVLAVSRAGRSFMNPGGDFQLFPGDRLILSGPPGSLSKAVEHLLQLDVPELDAELQDFAVAEIPLDSFEEWHGRTLADLDLRKRFGITAVSVRRSAGEQIVPTGQYVLQGDDRLVVAGSKADVERVSSRGTRSVSAG
jgi:Kef-type K+ transport system membrane component KefB/Trk K+ transport system NAD-binding subunit